jgi:YVTN family beta-propeller protein
MSPKLVSPKLPGAISTMLPLCILALWVFAGGCSLFNRLPTPTIAGPESTWTNMPVRFYAYEPNGTPLDYFQQSWSWGDGTDGQRYVHVYRQPGTYAVTCVRFKVGDPDMFIPNKWSNPSAPCTLRVLQDLDAYPDTVADTILVGPGSPEWVAGLPDGSKLYVTNSATDKVSVIDTRADSTVKTISVQSCPKRCVCATGGEFVYVANTGSNSISVINTTDDSVVTTIHTPGTPTALALLPGDTLLYIGHENDGFISVLRVPNGVLVDAVVLGDKLNSLAVKPGGEFVYAAAGSRIFLIRTNDNTVVATAPVTGSPGDMVFSPEGDTLYAALPALGCITLLRTSDCARIGQIACGDYQLNAPWRLTMAPAGTYFYFLAGSRWLVGIVRRRDNLLARISCVGDFAGGTGPQMLWPHPDGTRVYAPSPHGVLVLRPRGYR